MNKTVEFDQELGFVDHYINHPQMIPFIGKYWGKYPKLLIIAESHYLNDEDKDKEKKKLKIEQNKQDIKNWYKIKNTDLSKEQIYWTFTSNILNKVTNREYDSKGHSIFKNVEKAITDSGFNPEDTSNMFCYVSYMNFFQRPAEKTGESIKVTKEDCKIANDTLQNVIKIIEPDYIVFLSSKAWNHVDKSIFGDRKIGFSCHPACAHWNKVSKKYGNRTGKDAFIHFIQKNKIFESKKSL